jgi:uncharacterized protein involved in exopolysaccharide biosynthesis
MKRSLLFIALAFTLLYPFSVCAQLTATPAKNSIQLTPAYTALALRKVEIEIEKARLLTMYKERHPVILSKQAYLTALNREMAELSQVGEDKVERVTEAFGALLLRKVEAQVELENMLTMYMPDYPDVKNKKAELAAMREEVERRLK